MGAWPTLAGPALPNENLSFSAAAACLSVVTVMQPRGTNLIVAMGFVVRHYISPAPTVASKPKASTFEPASRTLGGTFLPPVGPIYTFGTEAVNSPHSGHHPNHDC
ncbi:hypothetical protein Ct61P_02721 [Colletotrichum tofieldiae]|nr:hypothetical protein Ct61P_02721 [Colletotrichum tofieldiae]